MSVTGGTVGPRRGAGEGDMVAGRVGAGGGEGVGGGGRWWINSKKEPAPLGTRKLGKKYHTTESNDTIKKA